MKLQRLLLCLLILSPVSSVAQQQTPPAAQLVLSGKIKVNGKDVAPGFAIATGDKVTTAAKSSAVVSLGKLGRVEALPNSEMAISFDESNISVDLEAGAAKVSKAEGVTVSVSTKDGAVMVNTPLAGSFTVDTECGNTVVTAHNISVDLRPNEGGGKLIAPGRREAIGTARPGCRTKRRN